MRTPGTRPSCLVIILDDEARSSRLHRTFEEMWWRGCESVVLNVLQCPSTKRVGQYALLTSIENLSSVSGVRAQSSPVSPRANAIILLR